MLIQAKIDNKTLDFKIINETLNTRQKEILTPLLQNCWDGIENPSNIEISFEKKSFDNFYFNVSFEENFFDSFDQNTLKDLELKNYYQNKFVTTLEEQKILSKREKDMEKASIEDLFFLENLSLLLDKALLSA